MTAGRDVWRDEEEGKSECDGGAGQVACADVSQGDCVWSLLASSRVQGERASPVAGADGVLMRAGDEQGKARNAAYGVVCGVAAVRVAVWACPHQQ